jgi:hypothetical protein
LTLPSIDVNRTAVAAMGARVGLGLSAGGDRSRHAATDRTSTAATANGKTRRDGTLREAAWIASRRDGANADTDGTCSRSSTIVSRRRSASPAQAAHVLKWASTVSRAPPIVSSRT